MTTVEFDQAYFEAWAHGTLARLAAEQHAELAQTKKDLKAALEAYRREIAKCV